MQIAIAAYVISALVYVGLDMAWLLAIARSFYALQMGSVLADSPRLLPAAGFYLLFPIGLYLFAIGPAIAGKNPLHALVYGALFGFFAYAAYDLTNWATLKSWSGVLTATDIAWGTAVSGVSALIACWIVVSFIVR